MLCSVWHTQRCINAGAAHASASADGLPRHGCFVSRCSQLLSAKAWEARE